MLHCSSPSSAARGSRACDSAGTNVVSSLRSMLEGAGLHLRRHVHLRRLRLALSGRKQDRESCGLEHDGWQHVYIILQWTFVKWILEVEKMIS